MRTSADLKNLLAQIDRRSYPAYKDTRGAYQFPGYILSIDHVQGDPFAAPSKLSVQVRGRDAGFPRALYRTKVQRVALQDELTRQFGRQAAQCSFQAKGSGQSGLIAVSRCGPEVLERTACRMDPESGDLLLRLEVGFPANGRTINARELEKILFDFLPRCIRAALFYSNWDAGRLQAVADLAEDQQYIREQLPKLGLCAFVADGSVLPRESGVSSRPMKGAVAFQSPPELAVTLELPHRGRITGMGIPKGITLIIGGGYHGKSTLLKALERGVYPHVAGDGREYVVTDDTAVKIRAEDGRSIRRTDISMFINDLPNGKDTSAFVTEDASGSTSQAANVVESMEAGTSLLLIDEDTSATNFMVREAAAFPLSTQGLEPAAAPSFDRRPRASRKFGEGGRIKLKSLGRDGVSIDRETIDLRYVEQLADGEQTAALGHCVVYAQRRLLDGKRDLRQVVDELEAVLDRRGLEGLCQDRSGVPFLARPRRQEIFACFDRYRGLEL